jgi:hypothetical protein
MVLITPKEFFARIVLEVLYDPKHWLHRIAALYIWMPRIRYSLSEFVKVHNAKRIRRQRKRPHVVSGKPYLLYYTPNPEEAQDCRIPLDPVRLQLLQRLVELDGADVNAYLPSRTMAICEGLLQEIGGIPDIIPVRQRDNPLLPQFVFLRDQLISYNKPQELSELVPVHNYRQHLEDLLVQHGIDLSVFEQASNDRNQEDIADEQDTSGVESDD